MLESRTYVDPEFAQANVAVYDEPELGLWAMIGVADFGSQALDVLVASLRKGLSLSSSVGLVNDALIDFGCSGSYDLLVCRFDSFHYEICCLGGASASVESAEGGIEILNEPTTDLMSRRVLGDLHEGESLVLALESPEGVNVGDTGKYAFDIHGSEFVNKEQGVGVQAMVTVRFLEQLTEHSREEFRVRTKAKKAKAALSYIPLLVVVLTLLGGAAYLAL